MKTAKTKPQTPHAAPKSIEPGSPPAPPPPPAPELSTCNLQLAPCNSTPAPAIIDAQPVPATTERRKRRHGHIASLPKLQRDMVGRMLANGVPYKNIVGALDESGFTVSERNVSNWVTGGGQAEWQFQHDLVLENRLDQDHLVDHLRRDDASELPEVGLQAAATRLSQILLQKTARADNVEANLGSFSQMVDVLCRLNREISLLQKQRDDSRRSLGPAYNPARIKDTEETSAIEHERFYSNPPADSGLAKPAEPPLLPPSPTSDFLAMTDEEDAMRKKIEHQESFLRSLQLLSGKKAPAPTDPKPLPPPEHAR